MYLNALDRILYLAIISLGKLAMPQQDLGKLQEPFKRSIAKLLKDEKKEYAEFFQPILLRYHYFYAVLAMLWDSKAVDDTQASIAKLMQLKDKHPELDALSPVNVQLLQAQQPALAALRRLASSRKKHADAEVQVPDIPRETVSKLLAMKSSAQRHAILQLVIIQGVYFRHQRRQLVPEFQRLQLAEAESRDIEVIDSTRSSPDYAAIEQLLVNAVGQGVTSDFFADVNAEATIVSKTQWRDAIEALMQRGLVRPVVADILRFHKRTDGDASAEKKSIDSELEQIVSRTNSALEGDASAFHGPLRLRSAVRINDLEEVRIISKRKTSKNPELISVLMTLRTYPYRGLVEKGLSISPNRTVTAFRETSMNSSATIEQRVVNRQQPAGMVGVVIPSARCRTYALTPSKTVKTKFDALRKRLAALINTDKASDRKASIWLFNHPQGVDQDRIIQLYKDATALTIRRAKSVLSRMPSTWTIDDRWYSLQTLLARLMALDQAQIETLRAYMFRRLPSIDTDKVDIRDRALRQTKMVELPVVKVAQKRTIAVVSTTQNRKASDGKKETNRADLAVCQHDVNWRQLESARRRSDPKYQQMLYEFVQHFALEGTISDEYLCRSCYRAIDLRRFVGESYGDQLLLAPAVLESDLESLPQYSPYVRTIKNLDKVIERICYTANITNYLGSQPADRYRRQSLIRTLFDLVNAHNKMLFIRDGAKMRSWKGELGRRYGFDAESSQFFVFEMDNDIFVFSSNEKDKFKRVKLNNLYLYIVFIFLSEMSPSQLASLNQDKKNMNRAAFSKVATYLFPKTLLVHMNPERDLARAADYTDFCWAVYYFASLLLRPSGRSTSAGLWYAEGDQARRATLKFIVSSFFNLANSILMLGSKTPIVPDQERLTTRKSYLYDVLSKRFFSNLTNTFGRATDGNAQTGKALARVGDVAELPVRQFTPLRAPRTLLPVAPGRVRQKQSWVDKTRREKLFASLTERISNKKRKPPLPLPRTPTCRPRASVVDKRTHDRVDSCKVVDKFVAVLQRVLGQSATIANQKINLTDDLAFVTHDSKGSNRTKGAMVFEGELKVVQDAKFPAGLIMVPDKSGNATLCYEASTLSYVGFRDRRRQFQRVVGSNKFLEVRSSLRQLLCNMGHTQSIYRLHIDEYRDAESIISGLMRVRLRNLKTAVQNVVRIVFSAANGHSFGPNAALMQRVKGLRLPNDFAVDLSLMVEDLELDAPSKVPKLKGDFAAATAIDEIYENDKLLLAHLLRELTRVLEANANVLKTNFALLLAIVLREICEGFLASSRNRRDTSVVWFAKALESSMALVAGDKDGADTAEEQEDQEAVYDAWEEDQGLDMEMEEGDEGEEEVYETDE